MKYRTQDPVFMGDIFNFDDYFNFLGHDFCFCNEDIVLSTTYLLPTRWRNLSTGMILVYFSFFSTFMEERAVKLVSNRCQTHTYVTVYLSQVFKVPKVLEIICTQSRERKQPFIHNSSQSVSLPSSINVVRNF